ncbi:MAG: TetR/AcrR family transcriptional regulator [Myxococcales bacterium]|nr:TetR/AcrR family transcriptional regulator [Myxococcales bacterium]
MARPAVIQDSAILDAAREVFLSRGFRATTAEVAARAGISEGSIFKRFRSKAELFQAAMGSLDELPPFAGELGARVGVGDIREHLVEIGAALAAHLRRVVPLHLMAWSNPEPEGGLTPACLQNQAPIRMLKALSGYFEGEMRAGRLARHDPEIVARAFVGAVHNFVVFDLLFQAQDSLPMPEETFLRGVTELLFRGVDPMNGSGTFSVAGGRS